MRRRSRADRLKENAQLTKARQDNPEARAEAKREGLGVGKRIRYEQEGVEHFGTVSAMHLDSVDVITTAGSMMTNGENIVINEARVAFSEVKDILGPSQLPAARVVWGKRDNALPPAPPRPDGYENCDIARCNARPTKVYIVRKVVWDEAHENGWLGLPHIVAVCKDHDEPYVEAKCKLNHDHATKRVGDHLQNSCNCTEPSHIPMLWQMGVTFEEFRIPRPEAKAAEQVSSPEEPEPVVFEFCSCSLKYGHKGAHLKVIDDVD